MNLGYRLQGLGLRVEGFGSRVERLQFGVWGIGVLCLLFGGSRLLFGVWYLLFTLGGAPAREESAPDHELEAPL
jgi:hypothetical protein